MPCDAAQKRLFLALPLPRGMAAALERHRCAWAPKIPAARYVPAASLHTTVLFLGFVAREDISGLCRALERLAERTSPFSLSAAAVRYAPLRAPRMIWLAFRVDARFSDFVRRCAETAAPFAPFLDWKPEKAAVPHVTLARFKRPAQQSELIRLPVTGLAREALLADRVALMESRRTGGLPAYRELHCFFLGGSPARRAFLSAQGALL